MGFMGLRKGKMGIYKSNGARGVTDRPVLRVVAWDSWG